MNRKIFDEVKINLSQKSTEELSEMWVKNNRDEWSEEAFAAVKEICHERGLVLSEQEQFIPQITPEETGIPQFMGYKLAGFGERFLAFILNAVSIYLTILIIGSVISQAVKGEAAYGLFYFLMWVVFFFVFTFEALFSTTPGYYIMGIRVINEKGKKITGIEALLRTLCRLIPFYYFFFSKNRWIHDRFSGTYVVRSRKAKDSV